MSDTPSSPPPFNICTRFRANPYETSTSINLPEKKFHQLGKLPKYLRSKSPRNDVRKKCNDLKRKLEEDKRNLAKIQVHFLFFLLLKKNICA